MSTPISIGNCWPGHHDRAIALRDIDNLRRSDPDALFDLEEAAVARGVACVRQTLSDLGFRPRINGRGGEYLRGKSDRAFSSRHL